LSSLLLFMTCSATLRRVVVFIKCVYALRVCTFFKS